MKEISTSRYHPQTDGLVEKFNSSIQSVMAKSSDRNVTEWDKQLPFLLFAYWSVIQESMKESPFYLLYGRDPRLDQSWTMHLIDVDDYCSC